MSPSLPADTSLRTQVYDSLRDSLTSGKFAPGQKLTLRFLAKALGVSLMPVREALRRLVAEGAFEMRPNRSVRVPLMTRAKILELRDIRLAIEGLAVEKAAALASRRQVAELRRIAQEIVAARDVGDNATDRKKIREYHFALYAIAEQPTLLRVIEGLWLQTGPYMNLLFPKFISSSRAPEGRTRLIRALQAHDAATARLEIERDIGNALTFVADLADAAGNIAPASPITAKRRRNPSKAPAAKPRRATLFQRAERL
jgi:DNA-binding GntR family transcriptional regulator